MQLRVGCEFWDFQPSAFTLLSLLPLEMQQTILKGANRPVVGKAGSKRGVVNVRAQAVAVVPKLNTKRSEEVRRIYLRAPIVSDEKVQGSRSPHRLLAPHRFSRRPRTYSLEA